MKKKQENINKKNAISIIIGIAFFLYGCENDIEKIKELTIKPSFPTQTADSIAIIRTDSANIILTVFAPKLERYDEHDKPYTVFPEGITVVGYNTYPDTSYSITAKYAINYENKNLWEARIDVVVNTADGDQINTEQLFWDKKKEIIYSEQFTRITNSEGVFYGEAGFEALQDGTKWKLKNIRNSTVNIKDE